MSVDPAETPDVKTVRVEKFEHFAMLCNQNLRQRGQQREDFGALREKAASQFADDERMSQNVSVDQQLTQA